MWALRLNVTHTLSLSLLFSLTHTHTLPLTHALSQCKLRNASFNTSFSSYPPTRAHITYKFFCKVKGNKTCSNFSPKLKMVVKTQVVPSTLSSSQKMARRLLRKYRKGGSRTRAARADSYWRLKKLVPSISRKDNISKLDVVLEAISYIQRLQDDLLLSVLKGSSRNCWKKISSAT